MNKILKLTDETKVILKLIDETFEKVSLSTHPDDQNKIKTNLKKVKKSIDLIVEDLKVDIEGLLRE